MYQLFIKNQYNETIELTNREHEYQIINIDGLNPSPANIITNTVVNIDGEKYNTSKLNMRNIVILMHVCNDATENRIKLYNFINTNEKITIVYKNDVREVQIDGYCETIENNQFEESQTVQLSILCPEPYLKSLTTVVNNISMITALFEFPFAIDNVGVEFTTFTLDGITEILNVGEIECGFLIEIKSELDGITNIMIYNQTTNEQMTLNTTLNSGETIQINTNKGNKSIYKYSGGHKINIINTLAETSTWLVLRKGLNYFGYSSNSPAETVVQFQYKALYKGV